MSDEGLAVPDGLKDSGARLWRKVTDEWDLDPQDYELLLQACHVLDELDRIQAALAAAEAFVEGSRGQVRVHPGWEELRRHRALLGVLLGKLDLEDEEPQTPEQRWQSGQARQAANARWDPKRRRSA